ncbi:MAG TPA: DUF5916 domain-containing protein [Pyrinomonadaceae bacterium]|nr:DUF5916 domain-containing protein [Pyrinomonadaceae bacterium]
MTRKLPRALILSALAFAALCIASDASADARQQLASNSTPASRPGSPARRLLKRLTLAVSETREGSRVRLTSDAEIEGYRTYTEAGRFFVLVPDADAAMLASGRAAVGEGFEGFGVEQRGDDALVSFALRAGYAPRVRASFNRLEITFAAQKQEGGSSFAPTPTATPTATPTPEASSAPAPSPDANAADAPAQPSASPDAAASKSAAAARLKALLTPEKVAPVRVAKFDKAPVIDGKLDDEIWKSASLFKDFSQIQPGDNIAPTAKTEVMVGYDSKTLYIAFRCFDDPTKVRASVPKRDQIFDDDYVGTFLDTFNDKRKAYALFWSPLGVQADGVMTDGQNEDYSPDIVMESKGALTPDGYVVEVAIPFKSLRYEAGKDKQWGVHFFRRIKRMNNELDSWMPFSRDVSGNLVQAGHLTGLEGISTERTLELIPSFTVSETGRSVHAFPPQPPGTNRVAGAVDTGRFINAPVEADFGLTAKYSLTPTVTLDFAYNPDFAQVEADATVVTANQRFPIFFEEKRPFFLEGKEIFDTSQSVVHTRAIVDPDFAAKLTGKRGRNTFGLIVASDAAPGNFGEDELDQKRREIAEEENPVARLQKRAALDDLLANQFGKNALIGVLRLKRDVGKESSLGLIATTYNFAEHHNHVLGFDGRFKLNPTTITSFQVLGTTLRDCDRDFSEAGELQLGCSNRKGFAYSGVYDVTGRHTGWVFEVTGRTRDYQADVGFTRRRNTNSVFYAYRWNTEPNPKAKLIQLRIQNFTGVDYDWQGRSQDWFDGTNYNFQFQHQTFVQIGTNFGYDRLLAEEFSGRFAGEDQERQARHRTAFVYVETTLNKKLSGFGFVGTQRGQFDFDFGAGAKYPRVSLAAVEQRKAQADGLCDGAAVPDVCQGYQDPGPGHTFDIEAGATYQPTSALRAQLSYIKNKLTRYDTGLVAFNDNIVVLRTTYQFTRFIAARGRLDYDTLTSRMRGQFLFGWTPNPGTALYIGYNDDLNRNGFNPYSGGLEPGFRRNGRTFFIKASYLFRRSFGGK